MWDKIVLFGAGLALGALGAAFARGYRDALESNEEENNAASSAPAEEEAQADAPVEA